jgi:GGDEF domain-containing protein
LAVSDIIESFTRRQEHYASRLREFAAQVEKEAYPADARTFSEVMAMQAAALHRLAEGMNQEVGSMMTKMREQTLQMDRRLASTQSTDAVTGLVNRQELEGQIEAHKLQGSEFSLLLFELSGPSSGQVLRTAAKIAAHFRNRDRVGRWGYSQFAVLFMGENKLAETRAQQVIADVGGRYPLDNGETALIAARVLLLQPELQPA